MNYIELDQRFYTAALNQDAQELEDEARAALAGIKEATCLGKEFLGWYHYPRTRGFEDAARIRAFQESFPTDFDLVVVVGIGGSYLGARAVYEALSHTYLGQTRAARGTNKKQIVFAGHHLSEGDLLDLLDLLDTRLPVINVISKSGYTTEPAIAFRILRNYMEARFGAAEANRRMIITTDAESGALRQLAHEKGLASFAVPHDVGGRYSVMTPVGLLPLALAGFSIESMLEGAEQVFLELDEVYADRAKSHPALTYAACRMAAYEAGKRVELLAYTNPKLRTFTEWWKQLFGESEGKQGKGIFPSGLAYTTDLHSLGQLVQSGERNLIETFLTFGGTAPEFGARKTRLVVPKVADNLDQLDYLVGHSLDDINAAAEKGTKIAHHDGGVPCLELKVRSFDERGLGALFAFFEASCAVSGALLHVNPFDQPGVETYKNNLFGLLGKPGFEDLGQQLLRRFDPVN